MKSCAGHFLTPHCLPKHRTRGCILPWKSLFNMRLPKGSLIFLFPWISSFLRIFEEYRMNEWKSCFFSPVCFFFPPQKSNEWMAFELIRGKEKKQKSWKKKKHKQLLLKKSELDQNLIEWPMNLSADKKNTTCFFFPLRGKKNTIFGFEWMNDQRTYPRK